MGALSTSLAPHPGARTLRAALSSLPPGGTGAAGGRAGGGRQAWLSPRCWLEPPGQEHACAAVPKLERVSQLVCSTASAGASTATCRGQTAAAVLSPRCGGATGRAARDPVLHLR